MTYEEWKLIQLREYLAWKAEQAAYRFELDVTVYPVRRDTPRALPPTKEAKEKGR